ncbi:myb-related protein MYBAS1-like protein [Cinnamomum micranthum f. kanehirae]|uniref:Myb-related protein MYBAS1-like protein n=1 Tax=Cinnamomum micranthum f. kanehirae TaxID=337451 RepID=A0A3S3Q5C4_9MAGN|nr:myb-related protein MYBAS1-like protein [Cinnamomum micranthum f. kanehirae]
MDLQDEKTRRGSWTPDEDMLLTRSVFMFGQRRWDYIARASGLKRSGKSCRMRWMNYLHPDLKHGPLSEAEEATVLQLHARWGNKYVLVPMIGLLN